MLAKRSQGRPARGFATVGPRKIVEGMQEALRFLRTSNVTRKDIAHFAGVTPALVTYYFPERNALVEAATIPIVENLSNSVREHLSRNDVDWQTTLLNITSDIVSCYSRDMAIIELYTSHSAGIAAAQDPLQDMMQNITTFFDRWLLHCQSCHYNGRFLASALLGLCKTVIHHPIGTGDGFEENGAFAYAQMICMVLIGGLSGSVLDELGGAGLTPASSYTEREQHVSFPPPIASTGRVIVREGRSGAVAKPCGEVTGKSSVMQASHGSRA